MTEALQYRIAGIVIAALIGLGVPLFLLGPWLFDGLPLQALPAPTTWAAGAAVVFAMWLTLVCVFAEDRAMEQVVGPFHGAEAVVLCIPWMLVAGSRSLWRRMRASVLRGK